MRRELNERVAEALEQLEPRERQIVALKMAGESPGAIAERLGSTYASVSMTLFKARRRLEQLLGLPVRRRQPRDDC